VPTIGTVVAAREGRTASAQTREAREMLRNVYTKSSNGEFAVVGLHPLLMW
jgi:hypothetical protein